MTQHVSVIVGNAQWVLFAWILANQGGVPVPVVPALFGVAALIASGRLSVVTTMMVAVGATLCADLVWYGLARWRGTRTLGGLASPVRASASGPAASHSAPFSALGNEAWRAAGAARSEPAHRHPRREIE
jgi:hypothetical protein